LKIALVILAYKNPQQLRWLMDAMEHNDHHFFLHIDRRKDIEPFRSSLNGFDKNKVTWLPRRDTHWGSMGCVNVLLDAFKQIKQSGSYDYVVHLSGQDFPLLDMHTWRKQLALNPKTSYFFHFDIKNTRWKDGGSDRLSTMHFFLFGKRKKINANTRNPLWKLVYHCWKKMLVKPVDQKHTYFGSEFYFIFHHDAVERILQNKDQFRILSCRMSFVLIPEELYLSTMLMADSNATPLNIENKTMRTIEWDMHSSSPKTLGWEDLKALQADGNWFARKFDFEGDLAFHQSLQDTIKRKSLHQ
jgi:hypothetical protein